MSSGALRFLLTLLLYFGVAIVLVPALTGKIQFAAWFMIGGAVLAVVCGLGRCYLTDGGCSEREFHRPTP